VTEFLSVIEVLSIHADQIERYGGGSGVRDPGQLAAALFRPQTGHYANAIEEAAALWESLSQNHPFIDGNKRTAFAVMYTFLTINGWRLTASAEAIYVFLHGLYESQEFTFEALSEWLRQNTSPAT
jgi:death on curing protein